MSIGLTISSDQQEVILTDLCERNLPAEFVYEPQDRDAVRSQVRFLERIGDTIRIDHPTLNARPVTLRPGETVELHFNWKQQRLAFRSQVLGRDQWSNGRTWVPAMLLRTPISIDKAQRRSSYRMSVSHISNRMTRFAPIDHPAQSFTGTLVDLSEGGARVRIDRRQASGLNQGEQYLTLFRLPGFESAVTLVSEIRWCQDDAVGHGAVLGLQFQLDEHDHVARDLQQRLGRFIAHEQIEALRRARGTRTNRSRTGLAAEAKATT